MSLHSFCAANSGKGFISLFDRLIDEENMHVFYIKGGPGCGKSTLMKKIVKQYPGSEVILCSGDPSSIDAVLIPEKKTLIMDATAPHSYEPIYPGVGGEIVDLGEAWNHKQMDKEKIIALGNQKKQLYKTAYGFLTGAYVLQKNIDLLLSSLFDHQRAEQSIERILHQNGLYQGETTPVKPTQRFFSAISCEGCITLNDSLSHLGNNVVLLMDPHMQGHRYLELLKRKLDHWCIEYIVGHHPLFGAERIQHLVIPAISLSFITNDGIFPLKNTEDRIIKTIEVGNFLNQKALIHNKNKLEFIKNTTVELIYSACEKLEEARNLHMSIEAEYRLGTNFTVTESIGEKLINKLSALS